MYLACELKAVYYLTSLYNNLISTTTCYVGTVTIDFYATVVVLGRAE